MSANISNEGAARVLDREPGSPVPLTEREVSDPPTLVRILLGLIRDVANATRVWQPRRIDFEGRTFLGDGTTKYRLEHGFKGKVRIWAVDWDSGGNGAFECSRDAATDLNTLVIVTHVPGTGVLRIEEAG